MGAAAASPAQYRNLRFIGMVLATGLASEACSRFGALPDDTLGPQDASAEWQLDAGTVASPEARVDTLWPAVETSALDGEAASAWDGGSGADDDAGRAGNPSPDDTPGAEASDEEDPTEDARDTGSADAGTAPNPDSEDAGADNVEAAPLDSGVDAPQDAGEATPSADDKGPDVQDSASSVDAGSPPVDCSPDAGGSIGASGAPALLACTGLYSDWPSRTIAASAASYDPGLHLWSDGADKSRYIALPPGTAIDTSNMDEWTFPIGTKVWKEFALGGKKVETRYLLKEPNGSWAYTTYRWSPDQSAAVELTTGATNVNGTRYEIPNLEKCRVCHMGRGDFVLGFEAIGLSSPLASGLTMDTLVARGWVTSPPRARLTIPGDATASAALGWLHANCGTSCHNRSHYALAGPTGFFMRLGAGELASVQATDTYATGVNVAAKFREPDGGSVMRIAPGNPGGSCIVVRAGYRDTAGEKIQMPPDDTHVVDSADLDDVKSWIGSL